MEWSKNEPISKSKASTSAKSPTRLQKHAPAALHLDGVRNGCKVHPCSDSFENTSSFSAIPFLSPIPLLSPLLQSPPREAEDKSTGGGTIDEEQEKRLDQRKICEAPTMGGWQHPAAATTLAEPSTIFALFQSQCSLVNPTL